MSIKLAVILAGGLGLRLRPLTNIIPKPLLPIGESTVLEIQILSLDSREVLHMRLLSIGSLLVLFTLTGLLHAQKAAVPAEAASAEMIANVLTELRVRYSLEDWKYAVEMKGRQFKLYRRCQIGRAHV